MKAVVTTGIGTLEIRELPTPVPQAGQALLRVHFCGICGSDINGFRFGDPYAPFPHIFGHEAACEIAALGSPTDRFQVGDKVVYEIAMGCGHCPACRAGRPNCCARIQIIGGHLPGAYAEYVTVSYDNLYRVPQKMDYLKMAVVEPYGVAAQGAARAQIGPEDTVLIIGGGAIALTLVDVAKSRGARVLLAARRRAQRERAMRFGADGTVDYSAGPEHALEQVLALTGGDGCHVVAEATGARAVMEDTVHYAAAGGRVLIMSGTPENVCFPGRVFLSKELTLVGSRNSHGQYPFVVEHIQNGSFHTDAYISKVFPYLQAQEAFAYAIANAGECLKVILKFSD